MKRIALCLLLMSLSFQVPAFELGASFRIENLAFTQNRRMVDTGFDGLALPIGASLTASHSLQDNLFLEAEYSYDDVLRNILTSIFIYRGNFYSFGVGPFLGFLNTSQIVPKVGVASVFKIEWPGVVFTEFWLDNTAGDQLTEIGHYRQERNKFSIGFYVPHAICSLNRSSKTFTQKTEKYDISDTLTEYTFETDIFKKNAPFKVVVSFGVQSLTKTFVGQKQTTKHTLNSLILGTTVDLKVNDFVTMVLDLDSSIYSYGQDELLGISNPGPLGGYLFRAVTGVRLNMDKLIRQ